MSEINIHVVRKLCDNKSIKWTAHVLMRLQERGINPSDIKNCILSGEIIEQYPTDYPYPSCLLLGLSLSGEVIHVVIGVGSGFLWIVTAYRPDASQWMPNFKERR